MQVKYDSINVGENQLAKISRRKLLCFPFGQTDRNLDINMFYFIKRLAFHSESLRIAWVLFPLLFSLFVLLYVNWSPEDSLHSHGRMRRVTVLHELVLGKFISNKWNERRLKNIA